MKQATVTVTTIGDSKIRNINCPGEEWYTVVKDINNAFYGGTKTKKALETTKLSKTLDSLGIVADGVRGNALVIEVVKIPQIFNAIPPVSVHAAKILVQTLSNLGPNDILPAHIEVPETYGYLHKTGEPISRNEIPTSGSNKRRPDSFAHQHTRAHTRPRCDEPNIRTDFTDSDDDDDYTNTYRGAYKAIEDKRPLLMTYFGQDQLASMGGAIELEREWSTYSGSQHAFVMMKFKEFTEISNIRTLHLTNRRLAAEAEDAESRVQSNLTAAKQAQALANSKQALADSKLDGTEKAKGLTNRKLLAEAEAAEEAKAEAKNIADAEQRRLNAKSDAEVDVLTQAVARENREASHRHIIEDNAASLAASLRRSHVSSH